MTTKEEVESAIGVLESTERGTRIIRHLYSLLDKGGIGLDQNGKEAIRTILEAAFRELPGTTLSLLDEAVGKGKTS